MVDRSGRDFKGEISAAVCDTTTMTGIITGKVVPSRALKIFTRR